MKRLTSWLAVGMCTALLGVALTAKASGLATPEKALLTVTEPLDVGGTILQPGDYQIKVVPLRLHRNLLQVTSTDGTKLFATLLSIPHPEGPAGEKVPASRFVYYPSSAGHIMALRTWFAGETPISGGHDIVYPKQRAMELAATVKEPVVAIPDEVKVAEYESAPLVVVTPDKQVKPYEEVVVQKPPVPAATPVPAPAPVPAAAPVPQAKVAENPHKRLPQTASDVPLYAGLGLLSLLGALGLGALARRMA